MGRAPSHLGNDLITRLDRFRVCNEHRHGFSSGREGANAVDRPSPATRRQANSLGAHFEHPDLGSSHGFTEKEPNVLRAFEEAGIERRVGRSIQENLPSARPPQLMLGFVAIYVALINLIIEDLFSISEAALSSLSRMFCILKLRYGSCR